MWIFQLKMNINLIIVRLFTLYINFKFYCCLNNWVFNFTLNRTWSKIDACKSKNLLREADAPINNEKDCKNIVDTIFQLHVRKIVKIGDNCHTYQLYRLRSPGSIVAHRMFRWPFTKPGPLGNTQNGHYSERPVWIIKSIKKINDFSNSEELKTSSKEWNMELVKSKVRGQTLHVIWSKESLQVNHQNRRYIIDTYTIHKRNRNLNFQQNLNDPCPK